MTPGAKSSEFVMSLMPTLLGVFFSIYGALKGRHELLENGLYLLLGGSGVYAASRTAVKLFQPAAPAPVPAPVPTTEAEAKAVIDGTK